MRFTKSGYFFEFKQPSSVRQRNTGIVDQLLFYQHVYVPFIAKLLANRYWYGGKRPYGPVSICIFRADNILHKIRLKVLYGSTYFYRLRRIKAGMQINRPAAVTTNQRVYIFAKFN